MGRRRKYFTEEEQLAAQAENSRRYYGNNHEQVREKQRNKYKTKIANRDASQHRSSSDDEPGDQAQQTVTSHASVHQTLNRASAAADASGSFPSPSTAALSASFPERLSGYENQYRCLTRGMDPLEYLIKLTEVNIADGDDYDAIANERGEFVSLAQTLERCKTELVTAAGAAANLSDLMVLERKVLWITAFLNDLCRPPSAGGKTLQEMLDTLNKRLAKRNALHEESMSV